MADTPDLDGASPPSLEILNPAAPAAANVPVVADAAPAVHPAAAGAELIPAVEPAAPAAVETPVEPEKRLSMLEKFDADKAAKDAKPAVEAKPAAVEAKPAVEAPKPGEPAAVPAPVAPADGEKPVEPVVEAAPAADLPKIDYFSGDTALKLPDVLKMDDAAKTRFTEAADAFRKDPSAGAQSLINMAGDAFTEFATQLRADQWTEFNKTRDEWNKRIMSDPVLGGNAHDTAMGVASRVRDRLVTDAKPGSERHARETADFAEMLTTTGVGDHPAFIRLLHNGGRYIDEARPGPSNIRPSKDNGRAPSKGKLNYTHPTSQT